jgi:hypothetical protein
MCAFEHDLFFTLPHLATSAPPLLPCRSSLALPTSPPHSPHLHIHQQYNLKRNIDGDGAPFGIFLHTAWLSDNSTGLNNATL